MSLTSQITNKSRMLQKPKQANRNQKGNKNGRIVKFINLRIRNSATNQLKNLSDQNRIRNRSKTKQTKVD